MSGAHVCEFVFEKNVTHVHVSGTPEQSTGPVKANVAGKYTCSCGAFELRDPVEAAPQVQHVPSDDTEGSEI